MLAPSPLKPMKEIEDYWGVTGPSLSYSEIKTPKKMQIKKQNNQKSHKTNN